MSVIAIIQARMGSTRLPKKILKRIQGRTVLEHVIDRTRAAKKVDDVIVAATTRKEDSKIVRLCAELDISTFCGSEDDVLDRYYQAARLFKAEYIVRITSDCPLIDPKVIDDVITLYFGKNANYATNLLPETFPDGEDVEVFSFNALRIAWENAKLVSEREHVTPFIRNNPNVFKIVNLECEFDLSAKRWTVDEPEDFEFVKIVYENLYCKNPLFGMEEILSFLKEHPEIERINDHIIRNEGYLKSLREDRILSLDRREK